MEDGRDSKGKDGMGGSAPCPMPSEVPEAAPREGFDVMEVPVKVPLMRTLGPILTFGPILTPDVGSPPMSSTVVHDNTLRCGGKYDQVEAGKD